MKWVDDLSQQQLKIILINMENKLINKDYMNSNHKKVIQDRINMCKLCIDKDYLAFKYSFKDNMQNTSVIFKKDVKHRINNKLNSKNKHKAYSLVSKAKRIGDLINPGKCNKCNSKENIQGHHINYSKPLDIIWLCQRCHFKEHKKIRKDIVNILIKEDKYKILLNSKTFIKNVLKDV